MNHVLCRNTYVLSPYPRGLGVLSYHISGAFFASSADLLREVMMFGMTGAGKSALGNLIAGQQVFDSGASAPFWGSKIGRLHGSWINWFGLLVVCVLHVLSFLCFLVFVFVLLGFLLIFRRRLQKPRVFRFLLLWF